MSFSRFAVKFRDGFRGVYPLRRLFPVAVCTFEKDMTGNEKIAKLPLALPTKARFGLTHRNDAIRRLTLCQVAEKGRLKIDAQFLHAAYYIKLSY